MRTILAKNNPSKPSPLDRAASPDCLATVFSNWSEFDHPTPETHLTAPEVVQLWMTMRGRSKPAFLVCFVRIVQQTQSYLVEIKPEAEKNVLRSLAK